MNSPPVYCVCITANRPKMLASAVECFQSQTYPNKQLLILDTGRQPAPVMDSKNVFHERWLPGSHQGTTVGALRNMANAITLDLHTEPCIIAHWDDDDWSGPDRLAQEVDVLQTGEWQAVGYRQMLFWDSTRCEIEIDPTKRRGAGVLGTVKSVGEAWLYTNGNPRDIIGTSLMYWRKTWEARPFPEIAFGEDTHWVTGLNSRGVTRNEFIPQVHTMVARIHANNTSPAYKREYLEASEAQGGEWARAPQWDGFCSRMMELAR